jgi:hypothetical protein
VRMSAAPVTISLGDLKTGEHMAVDKAFGHC